MKAVIDSRAGFCGGVIRAISRAEDILATKDQLFSLGAIVHNEEELRRLGAKGLLAIDKDEMASLPVGSSILIRAHGEPPATYSKAKELSLNVIDCTCPVVLKLQKDILKAHGSGKIIIFGKIGHAEVLGLMGQVDGDAIIAENAQMLEEFISEGKITVGERLEVFSQTTGNPEEYRKICLRLKELSPEVNIHETICTEVSSRHSLLRSFAAAHDVIIFVTGDSSSNGKVLFNLCKSVNPRTYRIGSVKDIRPQWFRKGDTVGVSGATSTPKWLLEEVARNLQGLNP